MRRLLFTGCLLVLTLTSCGHQPKSESLPTSLPKPDSTQLSAGQTDPGVLQPGADIGAIPAFPPDELAELPVVHLTSDGSCRVIGAYFIESHGGDNRIEGSAYAIIPEAGDVAWALYAVPGLTGDRPVELNAEALVALTDPGGEELPLEYWLGMANYTADRWDWTGPLDGSYSLQLNSETLRDRYVSTAGTLYCVVLVSAVDSAEISGVKLSAVTAVTSPEYLTNKPYHTPIDTIALGDGGKSAAALSPEQYVTITWTHVPGFGEHDTQNEAQQYDVLRRGPGAAVPLPIGSVPAPETTYVDPTCNDPEVSDCIPGATYQYYMQAANDGGCTPLGQPREITIPLLPPTDLRASDGQYADRIMLTWVKSEYATGYEIYRDSQDAPCGTTGCVSTWTDPDVELFEPYCYWLKATNSFGSSAFSDADRGFSADWQVHAVDTEGDVGSYTSMVVINGKPAISYYDWTNKDLKFARALTAAPESSADWQVHAVDTEGKVGRYTSLAVINGKPAICYYDDTNKDLKFARTLTATPQSSADWRIHAVDALCDVGEYTSMVVYYGRPAISYYDDTNKDLKFARASTATPDHSANWQVHAVDTGGSQGDHTSLAVLDNKPVISYHNSSNADLRFARALTATPLSSTDWQFHTVDMQDSVGYHTSIAILDGKPAISYQDSTRFHLKFALALTAAPSSGDDWKCHWVDALDTNVGFTTSLAVLDGRPVVSYGPTYRGCLNIAMALTAAPETNFDWQIHAAEEGGVGEDSSLMVLDGKLAASYWGDGDLKFARAR